MHMNNMLMLTYWFIKMHFFASGVSSNAICSKISLCYFRCNLRSDHSIKGGKVCTWKRLSWWNNSSKCSALTQEACVPNLWFSPGPYSSLYGRDVADSVGRIAAVQRRPRICSLLCSESIFDRRGQQLRQAAQSISSQTGSQAAEKNNGIFKITPCTDSGPYFTSLHQIRGQSP